jgi:hypothetical protein
MEHMFSQELVYAQTVCIYQLPLLLVGEKISPVSSNPDVLVYNIVGPGNQTGCIILRVGNLAD